MIEVALDLDVGGGEVGVAEVDHAASPQCETSSGFLGTFQRPRRSTRS